MDYALLAFIGILLVISASLVFSVVGFIGIVLNSLRMVRNTKEGTSTIRHLWGNRFNVMFRPQFLNAKGVVARKRLFMWIAVLIVSSVIFVQAADFMAAAGEGT